jgi:signal transduction histidine kinase
MKELINAILRLAQIEAQQSPSNFSPIDLNAFAREIYDTFSVVVEDQGKRLSLRVDDARVVNGEVALLNQAVANLIQNAINYGGDEISLFVEGASIGLADNGVGVPPGEFENIIRPMVRLDFARQREGSGLGLALVNAVAKLHGAKLVLDANQPSGLVVRLVFSSK